MTKNTAYIIGGVFLIGLLYYWNKKSDSSDTTSKGFTNFDGGNTDVSAPNHLMPPIKQKDGEQLAIREKRTLKLSDLSSKQRMDIPKQNRFGINYLLNDI